MADPVVSEGMPDSVTLKLRKPLTTHTGKMDSITIKAPKARDMRKMKVAPSTYFLDGRFQINNDVMLGYLEMLTGLDSMALDDLSIPDFNAASSIVRDYLGEAGNY